MRPAFIAFVIVMACAVFLFEWAMLRKVSPPERRKSKRLRARIDSIRQGTRSAAQDTLVSDEYREKSRTFYRRVAVVPGMDTLMLWIDQAGSRTKLDRLLWTCVAFGTIAGVVTLILTRHGVLTVATILVSAIAPLLKIRHEKNKRLSAFEAQLPEALDIVTRGLRAGHPFVHTLQLVAEELPDPIAEEFALTFAELNYGVPMKTALENMTRRLPSAPLKSLVTAILLQRETGGNLAEILEKISGVVRGGYRFQRKLRTLSAEGRMSATVLSAVPMVLAAGLYIVAPDIVNELFVNPAGETLLYTAGVMYVTGFVWIRRIIRIVV